MYFLTQGIPETPQNLFCVFKFVSADHTAEFNIFSLKYLAELLISLHNSLILY